MSTESSVAKEAINGVRTALGIAGVLSLIVGILILVWPGRTAMVVTAIIAIYAIVGGLVYGGLGIFSKSMGGWSRDRPAYGRSCPRRGRCRRSSSIRWLR